ncbi:MAG: nitrile hydratase accessory protein [Pseudomonadota bacterium]
MSRESFGGGMALDDELPRKNGELLFESPWEARAFGLAVALSEGGRFAWRDFSAELAESTRRDQEAAYYRRWLDALERLLLAQGLVNKEDLQARIDELAHEHHDHDTDDSEIGTLSEIRDIHCAKDAHEFAHSIRTTAR